MPPRVQDRGKEMIGLENKSDIQLLMELVNEVNALIDRVTALETINELSGKRQPRNSVTRANQHLAQGSDASMR
jgi:hypothetical protein